MDSKGLCFSAFKFLVCAKTESTRGKNGARGRGLCCRGGFKHNKPIVADSCAPTATKETEIQPQQEVASPFLSPSPVPHVEVVAEAENKPNVAAVAEAESKPNVAAVAAAESKPNVAAVAEPENKPNVAAAAAAEQENKQRITFLQKHLQGQKQKQKQGKRKGRQPDHEAAAAQAAQQALEEEQQQQKRVRAAIKIQAAFRGFLARKGYVALRSLVRLQLLMQSADVQRQTNETLHAMQKLVKMHSNINYRRRNRLIQQQKQHQQQQSPYTRHPVSTYEAVAEGEAEGEDAGEDESHEWDNSTLSKQERDARERSKKEAAMKRERALAYTMSRNHKQAYYQWQWHHVGDPPWNLLLQQHMNLQTHGGRSGVRERRLSNDGSTNNNSSNSNKSNKNNNSNDDVPHYMTPTESAKAKARARHVDCSGGSSNGTPKSRNSHHHRLGRITGKAWQSQCGGDSSSFSYSNKPRTISMSASELSCASSSFRLSPSLSAIPDV